MNPPTPHLRFPVNALARPMLARDADSIYWMGRYIERAEHIARMLLVNSNLLMDVGELEPHLVEEQWSALAEIMFCPAPSGPGDTVEQRVSRFMTLDPNNPNSIINCIARARENARGIREAISAEMWEALNTLYWSVQGEDAPARFEESHDSYWRQIMSASMLFQGLTDQTLPHDQRWHLVQLGKHLERIVITARVIQIKFDSLRGTDAQRDAPLRNLLWMSVLRSCCSIETYRRIHVGENSPVRVAAFLLLERNFPRTVRFAVTAALDSVRAIRSETNPRSISAAERILGSIDAYLEYSEVTDIARDHLSDCLHKVQQAATDAGIAVQNEYFLH